MFGIYHRGLQAWAGVITDWTRFIDQFTCRFETEAEAAEWMRETQFEEEYNNNVRRDIWEHAEIRPLPE